MVGITAFAGLLTWHKDPGMISFVARIDIWELALRNLTFFGNGLETFGTGAPYEFVHNDVLQLIFELGAGAAFAAPVFVYAVRSGSREVPPLVAIAGASLVSFPLHHPMGAALLAVLTGLCCGFADRSSRAEYALKRAALPRAAYERCAASHV
jgi:hypothetical protein